MVSIHFTKLYCKFEHNECNGLNKQVDIKFKKKKTVRVHCWLEQLYLYNINYIIVDLRKTTKPNIFVDICTRKLIKFV